MSRIFISYRRVDSEQFAARLRDALEIKLGPDEVFLDVEGIGPGVPWRARLGSALELSDMVLVIIGLRWLAEFTQRDVSDDQVLWEISTALEAEKNIIPVLLDGVTMPHPLALPHGIGKLAMMNAIAISGTTRDALDSLVAKIITAISRHPVRDNKSLAGLRQLLDTGLNLLERYARQDRLLMVKGAGDQTVILPAVEVVSSNDVANEKDVDVVWDEDTFTPVAGSREAFEIYRKDAKARGKSFYDSDTARLTAVETQGRLRLKFQPTSYEAYVSTNMAMDFKDPVGGALRDEVHAQQALESLEQSQLANHTGISGLVFSSDGFMLVQKRSAAVFTNPNQLSPGFSGTMTADDIARAVGHGETTCPLSAVNVLRELREEVGVDKRRIRGRYFMGISRELLRGGLPEMFYAVDVEMTSTEIQNCHAKDTQEGTTFLVPLRYAHARLAPVEARYWRDRFSALIAAVELAGGARASTPLLTNLAFWANQHSSQC